MSPELEETLGKYILSTESFNGFNDNHSLNLDRLPPGLQTQLGDLTQIEELFCVIITLDTRCRSVFNTDAMYYSVSVKKTGQELTTINYSTGVKPSCVVPNSSFICREGYICNPSGEPDPNTCADGYLRIDTSCNLCPLGAVCSGGAITGCRSGFSLISGACTCSTGYVTGTGTDAVCNPCPAHANCGGGTIINCQDGYYDATCERPCQGVVSGSWPSGICTPCSGSTPYWDGTSCAACSGSTPYWNGTNCAACSGVTPYWNGTSCAACPAHANCGGGTIINCQNGYYGAICERPCQGVVSGSWPSGICTPCSGSTPYWDGTSCAACSGSTPYWNGTSCAVCPAHANCSGGTIISCQSGYYGATCASRCLGVVSGSWSTATCVVCPSGSTTGGSGSNTNTPGCRCPNNSYYWNGSSCVSCPYGSLYNGSGTGQQSCSICDSSKYYRWNPIVNTCTSICGRLDYMESFCKTTAWGECSTCDPNSVDGWRLRNKGSVCTYFDSSSWQWYYVPKSNCIPFN